MERKEAENLINTGIEALEMTDVFLIDLRIRGNKFEVFLDSDEGITFQKCQRLSRWLEASLDASLVLGNDYTLEVSSAGVGSPLRFLRQYPKNIGKIIDVKYGEGLAVRGVLKSVEGNLIGIEVEKKVTEGKKTKKVTVIETVRFEDIIESKIKITFN
jgi:ribosome maturation factor RimP